MSDQAMTRAEVLALMVEKDRLAAEIAWCELELHEAQSEGDDICPVTGHVSQNPRAAKRIGACRRALDSAKAAYEAFMKGE
jgi:hypothetical protein